MRHLLFPCAEEILKQEGIKAEVIPWDLGSFKGQQADLIVAPVDMETHAMGIEAMNMGVPFAALRVISDDLSSPPLNGRPGLKDGWRSLSELRGLLLEAYRWWQFLRKFDRAVEMLHPVLVRVIRDAKGSGKWICCEP